MLSTDKYDDVPDMVVAHVLQFLHQVYSHPQQQ